MPVFQYPVYFWLFGLLLVVVGLYAYALQQKQRVAKRIGDPRLVDRLLQRYAPSRYRLKFIIALLSMMILVLALANPRKAGAVQSTQRQGIDVMIALDVSKSMLAKDISPSRLERARQFLGQMIDQLGENRVGMVVFAGRAYLQMPLSSDLAAARMYLSIASPDMVPTQGTVISEALARCDGAFNSQEKKYKSIILVSDGEDHDEAAIKTAKELASNGVIVHTVGIGSPGGSPLFDETTNTYKKDAEGNTVISKLNETALKEIAEATGGTYHLYSQSPALVHSILGEFAAMDQRSVRDEAHTQYVYYFPFLLAIVILLLFIEPLVSEKRTSSGKPARVLACLAFAIGTGIQPAMAQDANKLVNKGNEAYHAGEFKKAEEQYRSALEKKQDLAAARFNLGNALYKAGDKDAALKEYEAATDMMSLPSEKSNAWYNRGVLLQEEKKLPECIDAYKQALKLDPSNQDARINLQQALREVKKQQEQQQQQKQQDQKKKKQEQKEKEQNPEQQKKQKPEEQQPKPKISRQEAENRLKALLQQEKALQDKLHKATPVSGSKPEKDW